MRARAVRSSLFGTLPELAPPQTVRRVLALGGAGFLGEALVRELAARPGRQLELVAYDLVDAVTKPTIIGDILDPVAIGAPLL